MAAWNLEGSLVNSVIVFKFSAGPLPPYCLQGERKPFVQCLANNSSNTIIMVQSLLSCKGWSGATSSRVASLISL